jgi:hypothetical protein
LALAVGTGLQVLEAMLAEDVAWLVGPKGRHIPERAAVRHGSEPGQVTLGGRRVRVRRPRVRTADGARIRVCSARSCVMSSAMAEILRRFTRTVHELVYGKGNGCPAAVLTARWAGRLELWPAA